MVRAPGKVNLCLFLGGIRRDGRHELVSVVQPVSLADELRLEALGTDPRPQGGGDPSRPERDEVVCPGVAGENLAARALAAFRDHTGWDAPPLRLTIDKYVPVAAGMGGGSGDAAATLRLAAHAAGGPVPGELAPALGADVPAQIAPARALVTGAGEHVERIAAAAPLALVVVPSAHALSTADVFREADRLGLPREPAQLSELAERVREYAEDLPPELCVNDLEPAARSLCPSIDAALADLRAAGARTAMVSGSGPTVYGVFASDAEAQAAAAELSAGHPGAAACVPVGADFAAVRTA